MLIFHLLIIVRKIINLTFLLLFDITFLCVYRFLDKAAVITKEDEMKNSSSPHNHYNPWKLCSVTKVEEVKMMIRLLPIWATTIIFWTTYAQMITFSVAQASTLERSIGSFQIPAGSLTVFFVAAILITLAVYDRLLIRFWKRWKGKPGNRKKKKKKKRYLSYYFLLTKH